jgi:hypothetical protein
MLFKRSVLDRIAAGEVTLAFRRWTRPTVKAGSRLRTSIGELAIDRVDPASAQRISDADARQAGYASVSELRSELSARPGGDCYRIALRLAGPDSRVALRKSSRLSARELGQIAERLARLDRMEPWTRSVLMQIARHPGNAASKLAAKHGQGTDAFKRRVRQLKELGLTESLKVGYRLSPRGRAVLNQLVGVKKKSVR